MMNAAFQLHEITNQAMNGGAITEPIVPPATEILLAVARSRPENHLVIVFDLCRITCWFCESQNTAR